MNTTDSITRSIIDHFDYIEKEYQIMTPLEWEAFVDDDDPQARFGWSFYEVGAFCPQIIAAQTVHLPESELKDYLTTIFWILDRHIVLGFEQSDLDEDERHRVIESELYEMAVGSMDLMSEIELHALDSGTA